MEDKIRVLKQLGLEGLFIIFSLAVLVGIVLFLLVVFMSPKITSGIYVFEPNIFVLSIERFLMFFGIVGGLYTMSKFIKDRGISFFLYMLVIMIVVFILLYSWIGVI